MNATELYEITAGVLHIAGAPEWDSPEDAGGPDVLVFVDEPDGDDEPFWALAPSDAAEADYVPLDAAMVQELIEGHLRTWLADRGWQVQLTVREKKPRWRLADCLSVVDGGGDRLDDHYPSGRDELLVLVESVVVVDAS